MHKKFDYNLIFFLFPLLFQAYIVKDYLMDGHVGRIHRPDIKQYNHVHHLLLVLIQIVSDIFFINIFLFFFHHLFLYFFLLNYQKKKIREQNEK